MKLNMPDPILIPAKTTVLLVFLPSVSRREAIGQPVSLMQFVQSLQQQVGESVRVLRIDEPMHPEVVRSFAITHLPAFVLVQQGVELWRYEGALDETSFSAVSQRLLHN
jgi:thioredoxin-like negative regulator of GroEL